MISSKNQFRGTRKIHFVGIGGIGMSGIAHIVASLGHKISGSDLKSSEVTKNLQSLGATIFLGEHTASNVPQNTDVLVTSTAISPANAEVLAAKERGIPIIRRAEMLAEIMRLKIGIAIAGTHGKTTTTSLISAICEVAALSPTVIIGGKSFSINSNAKLGESEYLICEADESDGSFLDLSPVYCVVTNIDWDHMEFYGSQEKVISHFFSFINKTPFYGKSVLCFDDKNTYNLSGAMKKPYTSYALEEADGSNPKRANYLARHIQFKKKSTSFEVVNTSPLNKNPDKTLKINLPMLGRHNVLNALASIALCSEIGISEQHIKKGLENFAGIERRLTKLGTWQGLEVFDDYAHHPKEIEATLNSVREHYDHITVIFQPHRYTRTLQHYKNFAKALSIANRIYITPIYAASENPIENVNAQLIAKGIKKQSNVGLTNNKSTKTILKEVVCLKSENIFNEFISTEKKLPTRLNNKHQLIITMGAGDIYKIGKELVQLHK